MTIRSSPPARLALALLLFAQPAAAQHAAPEAELPTLGVGRADAAAVERAVRDLGESPVSALLDALGPDVRQYNAHITTLSNPFFEGRAPGTAGNRFAAEYIEFYFRDAKLLPAFPEETLAADGTPVLTPNASYRQPFEAASELRATRQVAEVRHDGASRALRPGEDFNVLGYSASADVAGPIVFVGYSLDNPAEDYRTYPDDADLSGKIALLLRFEPMDAHGKSLWARSAWSPHAALQPKIDEAIKRGAAGVILVNPPGADDPRATSLADSRSTQTISGRGLAAPVIMMSTAAADQLVSLADLHGRSLLDLRRLADDGGAVIDLPDARIRLDVAVTREPTMTDNIGAILPGRGELADDFIIIGAHYDHVGYGPVGVMNPRNFGKLHPGADDNASGTSGVLMLADKLSQDYARLPPDAQARSVMFLAFSAEESGLIGSRHFVRHPPISLAQIYLMINMDMIGRLRDGDLTADGVQTAAGMLDWLQPFFDESGLNIITGGGLPPNSDHFSFYSRDVPVLFMFTGLHAEYHTPADVGSTINSPGAVQVVGLVRRIALDAAQRDEPLEFTRVRGARMRIGRGDAPAEPPPDAEEPPDPAEEPQPVRGVRIRFGIAPASYADSVPGIAIGDVYEETSAAEAGLRAGDRIIRWNGREVADVESWMPMLAEHEPGDVVQIDYIRDGREHTASATLRARDRAPR